MDNNIHTDVIAIDLNNPSSLNLKTCQVFPGSQLNQGFEPSLEELDSGEYDETAFDEDNDDNSKEQKQTCSDFDEKDKCCYVCCSATKKCLKETVITSKEVCHFVKNRYTIKRSQDENMGWRRWLWKYLQIIFPCFIWIPKYSWKHLKGDIIAGLTTGFSVLPQGLAYGQIVELPAQYGLYSSIMGSYTYAVLGGCKDLAVGPSAVVSIVTAEYGTGRSPITKDPTYAMILAFFSGFILLVAGLLKLGF